MSTIQKLLNTIRKWYSMKNDPLCHPAFKRAVYQRMIQLRKEADAEEKDPA